MAFRQLRFDSSVLRTFNDPSSQLCMGRTWRWVSLDSNLSVRLEVATPPNNPKTEEIYVNAESKQRNVHKLQKADIGAQTD